MKMNFIFETHSFHHHKAGPKYLPSLLTSVTSINSQPGLWGGVLVLFGLFGWLFVTVKSES
jgi:sterol desaturase/sphingolipid hydroxylase (fatty acid hydroxylase superfamily)